ncbi:hypothetical protein ACIA5D_17830 [Actinoplanes sp. NPDC051513]|uniref:hypothetical protein n=1 Tax=Actinoplanes sp. NPDC051513 TaxID=3363908 RepID=UPI00379DC54F
MTTAQDAIARLDDGQGLLGDDLLLDVFEAHCQGEWTRHEQRLDAYAADRCVICGREGEGFECDSCTAGHDFHVSRTVDL